MSSVGIPKVVITLGAVNPPQEDIVDLRVHLGATREVSSFECTLENWNSKYSPGGASPIVVGGIGGIGISRGAVNPQDAPIISLRVEKVDYKSGPFGENWLVVSGRCWGERLFRRVVTKIYENVKAEAVVKDLLDNYVGLSHNRAGQELVEDTDTTYTRLEYDNTPVWDILEYVAGSSVKPMTGEVGYDFRVAPDGKFEFFPKNSKTSSVSLSGKVEVGAYRKDIHRIRNKIKVYGQAEMLLPAGGDEWTVDSVTNWIADIGSRSVTTSALIGTNALQMSVHTSAPYEFLIRRVLPSPITVFGNDGYKQLKFWVAIPSRYLPTGPTFPPPEELFVRLYAPGSANRFQCNLKLQKPLEGGWNEFNLPIGPAHEISAENKTSIWEKVGNPAWNDIREIAFYGKQKGQPYWVVLDGLHFAGRRFWATVEDSASQTAYGLRELVEVDEELFSADACLWRAKALRAHLKDPAEYLSITSDAVDYGTTPILAGDRILVVLPNENVNGYFSVDSVGYAVDAETQSLELTLELGKVPPHLTDFMYGLRATTVTVEKLARTKLGAGARGAGIGGSVIQQGYSGEGVLQIDMMMPQLDESQGQVTDFLFNDYWNDPASVENYFRFKDKISGHYVTLYGAVFTFPEFAPAFVVSHHLIGRKDIALRGQIVSWEGVISLLGGNAYRGWGPDPQNPMICLSGTRDTLEIRRGLLQNWAWGKLACGDLSVNGYIQTNLLPASGKELGSATYPWNKIFSAYGAIGDLTVPQALWIDTIYGLTNVDLLLIPYSGKKIKVFGNLWVTGNLQVDGTMPSHTHDAAAIISGILGIDRIPTIPYSKTNFANQNLLTNSDAIFDSVKGTSSAGAVKAGDEITLAWDATYAYLTPHFKDLRITPTSGKKIHVVGVFRADTYENLPPVGAHETTHRSGGSDAIMGALHLNAIPTIPHTKTNFADQNLLQSSDAIFNSVKGTDPSALKAGVEVTIGWTTEPAGGYAFIASHYKTLVVTASHNIAFYSGVGYEYRFMGGRPILPENYETGRVGNNSYPFYEMWGRTIWAKYAESYGCEKALSGQDWEREFQTREDAEKFLTHEVTKDRKHVKWSKDGKKIVCVCGKEVSEPCPEHEDEYRELYANDMWGQIEASSILLLELDAEFAKLKMEMESLKGEVARLREVKS